MAFEIDSAGGGEPRLLAANGPDFIDAGGHRYAGCFDGHNVIFSDGETDFIGRWRLGTPAVIVRRMRRLPSRFMFTFFDHGHAPQRLHALWEFAGSHSAAIEAWRQAGFSLSPFDRRLNRNHPRSSTHLRTKGASITGADSSHVVIFPGDDCTKGDIHVGEFNPFTGFGVGFVFHWMEGRNSSCNFQSK